MRRWTVAVVAGIVLGITILGLGLPPTGMSAPRTEHVNRTLDMAARSAGPWKDLGVGAATHSDSNTAGREAKPNPNVIAGRSTLICTTEPTWFRALAPAVDAWNSALATLTFGDDGTSHPLELYRTAAGNMPTGANGCTDRATGGVDVVAVIGQCRGGSPACYESERSRTTRRMVFETSVEAGQAFESTEHATLIARTSAIITFNVAVHELGHVLGLRDYQEDHSQPGDQGCERLRNGTPDVDPLNNHFSVMRNQQTADCWSEGVITGRDLRDFYEAYHVGAITNVSVTGLVTLNDGTLSATLSWRHGINQANHNASHVVILRQAAGSTSWDVVTSMPISSTLWEMPFTDRSGTANRYKVVGVTRGDIRRQGDFDETVTIGGVTYVEGDPTIIAGIAVWGGRGLRPAMLSASVSPRYCFTGGSLTVSLTPVNTRAVSVRGADGATDRSTPYNADCGSVSGERSFTVTATTATATHTISLPVNVHAQPTRLALSNVWIQEADGFTVASGSRDDEISVTCRQGAAATVHWTATGGAAPVGVWLTPMDSWMPQAQWAAGYAQSLATAACPATGSGSVTQGLGLIALGAAGGGVEARGQDIQRISAGAPAAPTGFTVSHSTQRDFNLTWNAVAGATGYDVKVRSNGLVLQFGNFTTAHVWAPEAGMRETIFLRSRDSRGNTSEWVPTQGRTQDPTLDEPTSVRAHSVTSTSAVLQWVPVPNVHFYEVWHSGWTTTDTTTASIFRFTDLEPGTDYRLSVRTRSYSAVSHWVKVRITTPP